MDMWLTIDFFRNSRLFSRIQQNKIYKKFRDLTTLTITLECFLFLCEAIIESFSCMVDSVHLSNSSNWTKSLHFERKNYY